MTVSAKTLSLLMAAGLEGEPLLAVVKSIEADFAPQNHPGGLFDDLPAVDPPSDYPPQAFACWYGLYPHKVGRAAAEKSFNRVRKARKATFAELVQGLRYYIASKPEDRPWANPATWLNQERWADQPADGREDDDRDARILARMKEGER